MDLSLGPRIQAYGQQTRLEPIAPAQEPAVRVVQPDPRHQAQFGPRDNRDARQREAIERAEQRLREAIRLVSQVGELIGQVRSALEKNEEDSDAPRSNARLLRSAAETVRDLVENARSRGEAIFESVAVPTAVRSRHALAAYASHAGHYRQIRDEGEPPSVRVALRKAEHKLKGQDGVIGSLTSLADRIIYRAQDAEPILSQADMGLKTAGEELRAAHSSADLRV